MSTNFRGVEPGSVGLRRFKNAEVSASVYPGVLFQFVFGLARSDIQKAISRSYHGEESKNPPIAVGATFISPVHITGFFSSRSRIYLSK
jgi:hypothetical protein